MVRGRGFLPEDDVAPGASPVAILSYAAWTGRFGRDPAIIGRRRPVALEGLLAVTAAGVGAPAPVGRRRAWFDGTWHDTPVYRREQLGAGAALTGPAIVEQLDTTTVIEPGDRVRVDAMGNLEIAVSALRA